MPNQQVQHPVTVPTPTTITPALLKTHSITPEEYTHIEAALGRTPSLTELGIFSVMWSEHCSYKSSRVHLKRLPTKGARLSGPGVGGILRDIFTMGARPLAVMDSLRFGPLTGDNKDIDYARNRHTMAGVVH